MLNILFDKQYLDYKKLILDNVKSLGLSSDEALVLIKILDQYPNSKTISISALLDSLSITQKKLESTLSSLMERKFYELYIAYDNGVGQEYIRVEPLFQKIENILNNNIEDVNYNNEIYTANKFITEQFNRVLTSNELEILTYLITDEHYTIEEIKEVTNSLLVNKRNLNMKSLVNALTKKRQPAVKKEVAKDNEILKDFFSRMR